MDTEDDSLVEEYEILEEKEIKYSCDCRAERFQKGIMTLGKEELKHIWVKYPIPQSLHVALPDFSAGAMENWGLVTYREVYLLVDENSTNSL